MPTAPQLNLKLPRQHRRDTLGDMSVAMHITGWDSATITDYMVSGDLLWVWNVASDTNASRAEWRFWIGELMAPAVQRDKELVAVVNCVIGKSEMRELSVFSVHEILRVSRQQVHRLIETGELDGHVARHVGWVTRASLVEFLKRRWVGNIG